MALLTAVMKMEGNTRELRQSSIRPFAVRDGSLPTAFPIHGTATPPTDNEYDIFERVECTAMD